MGGDFPAMANWATRLLALAMLLACVGARQVHRFAVRSASEKQLIDEFVADHRGSEVWDATPNSHMDVLLEEAHLYDAARLPLHRSLFIPDVESLIQTEEADTADFHAKYHSSHEYGQFLAQLAKQNPDKAELVKLGESVQGKPMVGLRIGHKSKPEILIQGGLHAREWIAPASLAFAAEQLLQEKHKGTLEHHSVMIVPTANPDGYDYTQRDQSTRMWRKNLEHFTEQKFELMQLGEEEGSKCYGTDLNRNWMDGRSWPRNADAGETSDDQCSDTYQGDKPMSEKEVQNMAKYLRSRQQSKTPVTVFIDVHSYSQKVIPAGCNNQKMSQSARNRHLQLTQTVAEAMSKVKGSKYTTGNCVDIMYPCSGIAHDYAHFQQNVPDTMAIELRDHGQYGFMVPPSQIKDGGHEMVAAIQTVAHARATPSLTDTSWAEAGA